MQLAALYRYPLKSAIGEPLDRAWVDGLGIRGDRRWMLVEADSGRFLTQRVLPQMTQLLARWQGEQGLCLRAPGMPDLDVPVPEEGAAQRRVSIWKDEPLATDAGDAAADRVSRWLGRDCRLVYLPPAQARQVDPKYAEPGPRVALADGFRPNLVIAGSAPYAEDGWRRIRIGDLILRPVKPCTRCIITTLDPDTGERSADQEPLATLARYRKSEKGVMFGQNLVVEGQGWL